MYHDHHQYFMSLDNNEYIDASRKANIGRFINHSCDPNCRIEKWTVLGEQRVGIFADKDIKKGTELSFDYSFVQYGKVFILFYFSLFSLFFSLSLYVFFFFDRILSVAIVEVKIVDIISGKDAKGKEEEQSIKFQHFSTVKLV